ncbi:MAG: metallophosphoesterase [Alphaproteobacteria bacterium]|nr:metallophosphoesterase [Alphaproteobacteria bacterium]
MTVFFTADHHFGQSSARGLFKRPFADVAAMDAAMIARWNATVAPTDTVWHLGDLAIRFSSARVEALLATLAGTKHLIAGNNDPAATREAAGWAGVGAFAELEVDGTRVVLCHYALRVWNGQGKGAWNLHGHSHGRLAPLARQADVGVDARDFRPVTLDEIKRARRRGGRGRESGG